MSDPRVSVLLPVFNGARYLDESIRSVLEQKGTDFELVIVDDASTDATREILRRWEESDERVRVLQFHENRGASEALNAGLAVARGTYIARQDADDLSMPGRLAAQVAFLDAHREVLLTGTNFEYIDEGGRFVSLSSRVESPAVLAFLLNFTNALGVPSQGMFRAEAARAAGGFSREFRFAQGYELWTRLAMRGRIAIVPVVGLQYRMHSRSATALYSREQAATATEVSRRMLSHTLGRDVTTEEADAVRSRWRHFSTDPVTRRANAVISEAYHCWIQSDPSEADRRRARVLIARRFARSAVSLARRRQIAESGLCARIAASWHPAGFVGVASETALWIRHAAQNR